MDQVIGRLAATPRTLAHLAAEASDERLDAGPAGGWSPRTILAHFRDAEFLELRVGLERMLAESEPRLVFLPADSWAASRNRLRDRKDRMLGDFALQRQASIAILRGLRPEDLERRGRIGDRDPMTVRDYVEFWARHDTSHITQLEEALGETLDDVLARRGTDG